MKNILLTILCCGTLIVIILFAIPYVHAQVEVDKYYFFDGRTLLTVYNEDPRQVDPKQYQILYWEIRLYKRGEPTGGHNYWGSISGKSANSVLNQLKQAQKFQKEYAKWMGRDYEYDEYTHFNPLGPIARTKLEPPKVQPSSVAQALVKQLGDYYVRLQPLYQLFSNVQKVLSKQPKQKNPFRDVGKITKEYADNLAHATAHIRRLQTFLAGPVMADQVSKLSNDLDGFIKNAESLVPEVNRMLGAQEQVVWKSEFIRLRSNVLVDGKWEEREEQSATVTGDNLIITFRRTVPSKTEYSGHNLRSTTTCKLSSFHKMEDVWDLSDREVINGEERVWRFRVWFSVPCERRYEDFDEGTVETRVSQDTPDYTQVYFARKSDADEAHSYIRQLFQ